MWHWQLSGIGCALLVLSIAIVVKQKRAASCPAHNKLAGLLSYIVLGVCIVAGAALLLSGWWLR